MTENPTSKLTKNPTHSEEIPGTNSITELVSASSDGRIRFDIQSEKRRRISMACDYCNKRKIKCDGRRPACGQCVKQNLECTFNRQTKKKRNTSRSISTLSDQSSYLVSLAGNPILKPCFPKTWPPSQSMFIPRSIILEMETSTSKAANASSPLELTSHEIDLIDIFLDNFGPIFPVFHLKTIKSTISLQPNILIKSMCAIGSRYQGLTNKIAGVFNAGDHYYEEAKELVDSQIDQSNPLIIAAVLLLGVYAAGSGRINPATYFTNLAIRMAQTLHLNMETDQNPALASTQLSFVDKEHRRRVWWMCFLFDTIASAQTAGHSYVHLRESNAHLPVTETLFQDYIVGNPEPTVSAEYKRKFDSRIITFESSPPSDFFSAGIHLNPVSVAIFLFKTFKKVIKLVNLDLPSENTAGLSSASLNLSQKVAEITSELEQFQAFLPHWMKSDNILLPTSANEPRDSWKICLIHFIFYTCQIMMHRPTLVHQIKNNIPSLETHAYTICVSAAKKMTHLTARIAQVNPMFFYMNPFVGFCIFHGGLIHAVSCQLQPKSINENFKTLHVHLMALQGLANFWYCGSKTRDLFATLLEQVQTCLSAGHSFYMPIHLMTELYPLNPDASTSFQEMRTIESLKSTEPATIERPASENLDNLVEPFSSSQAMNSLTAFISEGQSSKPSQRREESFHSFLNSDNAKLLSASSLHLTATDKSFSNLNNMNTTQLGTQNFCPTDCNNNQMLSQMNAYSSPNQNEQKSMTSQMHSIDNSMIQDTNILQPAPTCEANDLGSAEKYASSDNNINTLLLQSEDLLDVSFWPHFP